MRHIKLAHLIIFISIFLLVSCKTDEERRIEKFSRILTDSVEHKENVQILSLKFDSIELPIRDVSRFRKALELSKSIDNYYSSFSDFRKKLPQEQNRVWLKTMSPDMVNLYNNLIREQRELKDEIGEFYWSRNSSDSYYKLEPERIKYKVAGTEEPKYALLYFDKFGILNDTVIFNEVDYSVLKYLANSIRLENASRGDFIIDFESIGVDMVPADEDPTKSKEEREEIKERQEREKRDREIARMKRTNPIKRTFWGSTLGKSSASSFVNYLKRSGWHVEIIANYNNDIDYYCDGGLDDVDGFVFNQIKILVRNGLLFRIIFTDDHRLGWGAQRRVFDDEVRDATNRAHEALGEKYDFWYKGSGEYNDGTTLVKIENNGSYEVWATYE